MTTEIKVQGARRSDTNRAVFARNHQSYLDYATSVDAERPITFRSAKEWINAAKALTVHGPGAIPIFFAVISQPLIQFKAYLHEVVLRPDTDAPETQRLLRMTPPETEAEGVWKEGAGTLYAIVGCHRLEKPFPLSELRKASDGLPLSDDFRYSYALVLSPEPSFHQTSLPSPDTSAPPARVEAKVMRVVRDTSIIRHLKHLHNDTCQLCHEQLRGLNGFVYSEGHHLRPLGRPHDGPDSADNVIVVCPNCHALLDRCAVTLDSSKLRQNNAHHPNQEYIEYHNRLVAESACRHT